MTLYGDVHEMLPGGPELVEIGGCNGAEDSGKGEPDVPFVRNGRHAQTLGHHFGGALGHVLHPPDQDRIVEARGDGENALPKGQGTGSAGPLGPGGRPRDQTQRVGENGAPVGLAHEKVVAVVAQVESVDIGGVQPLVHRGDHRPEGLQEKVLGIAVPEHAELGHPRANQGYPAAQISLLSHCPPPRS